MFLSRYNYKTWLLIAGILLLGVFPFSVYASNTNGIIISTTDDGFAWSDQAGWINFGDASGDIHIQDSGITGHAWSTNHGWINMNPPTSGVRVAGNGQLSGFAWGAGVGWIDFSDVSISATGHFSGVATGVVVGTITFDCSTCVVDTDYVPADFRTDTTTTTPSEGNNSSVGGQTIEMLVAALAPVTGPNTPTSKPPSSQVIPLGIPPSSYTDSSLPSDIIEKAKEIPEQLLDIQLRIIGAASEVGILWLLAGALIPALALYYFIFVLFVKKRRRYVCPICKTEYQEKKWAERCMAWCNKHQSCNLEIISHAIEKK